jgi:hypothetical protein
MTATVTQSTAEFTEDEKDGILRLLQYPNWAALAQSIQLGYPAASQPLFLVFDAFQRIRPPSRARIRLDMCRAFDVECQIAESAGRREANKIAEVTLNRDELADLLKLLDFWTKRIADALGVVPNPYSQMEHRGAGGGANARVVG